MLDGGGGGAPKTGIKISFIVLALSAVIAIGCYVYDRWSDVQAEQALVPRLAVESMVKSMRQYQKQTGQFPNDFGEVEQRIWKHQNPPDFGPGKRTLSVANYYYMYSKVDPLTCAVWAIPSGPKRDEASTHFLVIGLDVIRHWKGPTLSKADIEKLVPVPTSDVLSVMGMSEQPMIDQRSGATKPVQTSGFSSPAKK